MKLTISALNASTRAAIMADWGRPDCSPWGGTFTSSAFDVGVSVSWGMGVLDRSPPLRARFLGRDRTKLLVIRELILCISFYNR